jgi:beta-galactosidase
MWNEYYETWFGGTLGDVASTLGAIHKYHPQKPVIIAEYGICEPAFKGGDPRRIEHMPQHIKVYKSKPYVAGAVYFSSNDYRTFIGEEGSGRFRQRVHGIFDICDNKKPSADTLTQLFSPLVISGIEKTGNGLKVSLSVSDGIPSYSINGYQLILSTDKEGNDKIGSVTLGKIKPNVEFVHTFRVEKQKNLWLFIKRPTGFPAFSKEI